MRLPLALLAASVTAASAQQILFKDTFDRANNRNIDAVLTGITNNTTDTLPADAVYSHAWLDPANRPPTYGPQDGDAANGGGAQILNNALQLATGAGTSNAFVNHNFTDPAITTAQGFSVSAELTAYAGTTAGQGGGFGIGMTLAEAQGTGDAISGATKMQDGFVDVGFNGAGNVSAADFWVVLRGNSTLAWGGRGNAFTGSTADTALFGTASVGAKTGRVTVNFTNVTNFNAGTTVSYTVLFNDTPVTGASGTFTWSDPGANYIGLDARDGTGVSFDNFTVSTHQAMPAVTLAVSPAVVDPGTTSQPVTLTYNASNLPAGATYQITADKAVTFPSGGSSGAAANGTGTVAATVNGSLGDTTFTITLSNNTPAVIATATAKVVVAQPPSPKPNVVVILADDLGWGDLGSYGGEIPTPNLDALAANGLRFRQFYQSARCSPTRVSLLTGLYPQQGAVNPAAALPDLRNDNNVTFAELLGSQGYRTYLAGKWHLGNGAYLPENRGFQHVWRMADGQANNTNQWDQNAYTLVSRNNEIAFRNYTAAGKQFYQTDAIGDYGVDFINHNLSKGDGAPFAMFLSFGAPHFPIQAPAALADSFMPTYSRGWDVLRRERYDRQMAMGVINANYPYPALGGVGPHQAEPIVAIPPWDTLDAARKADSTRRMALYAAMIQKLDENVGKVVERLRAANRLDNTLILFMSDNGANHERGVFGTWSGNADPGPLTGTALTNMGQPGPSGTANDGIHYGGAWSHVSNSPLKLSKHFTHEGGIRSPLIAHWPAGFSARNEWRETPAHLIDVMPTLVAASGSTYPTTFAGHPVLPMEGISLLPVFSGTPAAERPLFIEHESNRAVRKGKWKLVTESFTAFDQEFTAHQKLLFDMNADPGESTDVAAANPAKVVELVDEWNAWATRVGLPAGRLMTPAPVNRIPSPTPADLFVDTFNRATNNDADASATGMWGSRVPPIGAGAAWFEGYEGSGTAESIQVIDSVLQMATGAGMSENGVRHNFIGQDILDAGGFSVSTTVLEINSDATDFANRFVGFGVGLNATEAAGGNDIGTATPRPIRGNTANPGSADCFLELDLNGNVKLWLGGSLQATVPVGRTTGTLTAAFATGSFASGAAVTVSAYLDGVLLDLDPSGPGVTRSFNWNESNANHIALSARAVNFARLDNFAVRRLPLAAALATDYVLGKGLQSPANDLTGNPDGDRLDNYGEWAFGTDPAVADDVVSATALQLVAPQAGTFRFAHRRLAGHAAAGLQFTYLASPDLVNWHPVTPLVVAAAALPASPGYEVVTLELPPSELAGQPRLFLKITAGGLPAGAGVATAKAE